MTYMFDWICKNMATEISLVYSLTESCSAACLFVCLFVFIVTFYLFNRYPIGHRR